MTLEARRLKFCVSRPIKNGIGAPAEHDDPKWPRYVRITDIQDARTLRNDTFRSLPPELAAEASFDVGDILAAAVGATFGKAYLHTISTGPVAFAGYLVRISPSKEFDARYVAYWTESHHYWSQVNSNVIQATIQNFSAAKFAELEIPVPIRDAQILIANYLDRETARIDGLIAEKERMLALLEEKRAALTSRVVTRGLDPNAPLKPSGQEWLGEIPAHWKLWRLKYLALEPLSYGANEAALEDNPSWPRFVRITDIAADGSLRDETFKSLSPEIAKPFLLEDGDLLFARSGATVGKSFIYRPSWGIACFAGYLIRFRCDRRKVLPDYLNLFAQSSAYWHQVATGTIQATIQNFSAEKYADIIVALPPMTMQQEILEEMAKEQSRVDGLTSQISNSLALMRERRAALITAAVTGQIPLEDMTV